MQAIDPVLTAARPAVTPADVAAIARDGFGITAAVGARELGSERDQAFLVIDRHGHPVAVVKVSNAAEEVGTLDLEAAAALRIAAVDPDLPVALPLPVVDRATTGALADHRGTHQAADGSVHHTRAYRVLPGRAGIDPRTLDDRALAHWGAVVARVGQALRGITSPSAARVLPWDVQHAHRALDVVHHVPDPDDRRRATAALERFAAVVVPRLPALRHQVLHGDLTVDNVLADETGLITGVVDFGDCSHAPLLTDLASLLASVTARRPGGEAVRAARIVLDGYRTITPLEDAELDLVVDAWTARNAAGLAIASWRVATGLEGPAYTEQWRADAAEQLRELDAFEPDPDARAALAHGPRRPGIPRIPPTTPTATADLAARRDRAFGRAIEPLSYHRPVAPVRAEGCWMVEADGTRLLDAYNNVPCVGHGHPRVVEAIARQARRLNTNLRYLHGLSIELAERLLATCPPAWGLDTVLYVNSGTEANDLAWRLATAATGDGGGLCTAFAYHGVSPTMAWFSPESQHPGADRGPVESWTPPDALRGLHAGTEGFQAALDRLEGRGFGLAATILDGVLQSDGVLVPDPAHVQHLARLTRDAGGLWIADEVQGGHGRTGAMWSVERFGITPDVVTLGKPMGNGHPVAAVLCRREHADRSAGEGVLFSTFGGNPVSAAAALAVLDVLEDEQVLPRTAAAGQALRDALGEVDDPRIGDVRGVGLAVGVEVVGEGLTPDGTTAARLKEAMRDHGVLIGTTGPQGNVLKVRPPLAFTTAEVPLVADALRAALAAVPPDG